MRTFLLLVFTSIFLFSCDNPKDDWTSLLDNDLSQWDNYLSFKYPENYQGEPPRDEAGNLIPPVGLNQDQYNVFTAVYKIGLMTNNSSSGVPA